MMENMVKRRWIYCTFLFLFAGLLDSVYLTYHHHLVNIVHPETASMCSINAVIDCDQVAVSEFSTLYGIPVSTLGVFAHLFLVIFLAMGLTERFGSSEKMYALAYAVSLSMLLFSLYEATLSIFVLRQICPMCSILYGSSIGLVFSIKRAMARSNREIAKIAVASLFDTLSPSKNKSLLWPGLLALGFSLLLSSVLNSQIERSMLRRESAQSAPRQNALQEGIDFLARNGKKEGVVSLPSGLQYTTVVPGTGTSPTANSLVTVHYIGRLLDGTEFHNSRKSGSPATFALSSVIPGWREGIEKMRVGGKRVLFIPSHLAYGDSSPGKLIAPHSTLIFEIELLEIRD